MPCHFYYKANLIERDYGVITHYLSPKSPHPESTLWRENYVSSCPEDDILHDQAADWKRPGVHYHQHLKAGENTLNIQIARLLAESLVENNGYDQTDFAKRYIDFMLRPGAHKDTYVEECHRTFFKNHGMGKALERCGGEDCFISSLSAVVPLVLFYHKDHDYLLRVVRQHLSLIQKGETAARAGELFAETLCCLIEGQPLEQALFETIGRDHYQVLTFPYRRWMSNHSDEEVVGRLVGSGSHLEDAQPATYYLALKYADSFESGLIQNCHLGGDNCNRGAALGSLLGAAGGCEVIPGHWVEGLVDQSKYDALGDALWTASGGDRD